MRRIAALVAILVATGVVAPTLVVAAAAEAQLAVPTAIPEGWYVIGARAPLPSSTDGGYHFYSRDLRNGPALAVGTTSCDGGCDELVGRSSGVRGPRDVPGTLVRSGNWVWMTWSDASGAQDLVDVVIAHGLSNAEVVAAGRASRDGATRIARAGLPDGFRDRRVVGLGPPAIPYDVETITLLSANRGKTVELRTYVADARGRAAQRFFAAQQPLMSHDFQHELVAHVSGSRVAVANGDAPRAVLDAVTRSVRPVDDAEWAAFRSRVAETPVLALLPGLAGVGPYTEISGSTATMRWAAAFISDEAGVTSYTALVDVDAGMIASGGVTRAFEPGRVLTLATSGAGGMQLFTGVVPPGTASVRIEGSGTPPIAEQPSDTGPPAGGHYYAVLAPVGTTITNVVALDANGIEIARS